MSVRSELHLQLQNEKCRKWISDLPKNCTLQEAWDGCPRPDWLMAILRVSDGTHDGLGMITLVRSLAGLVSHPQKGENIDDDPLVSWQIMLRAISTPRSVRHCDVESSRRELGRWFNDGDRGIAVMRFRLACIIESFHKDLKSGIGPNWGDCCALEQFFEAAGKDWWESGSTLVRQCIPLAPSRLQK